MNYFYLASPYSSPDPMLMQYRYLEAERALAWLYQHRIWTYSPIVHCHALASKYTLPKDNSFWQDCNRAMILPSRGLILLCIDGWYNSEGCLDECSFVRMTSKTIQTMTPSDDQDYILEDNPNPYRE